MKLARAEKVAWKFNFDQTNGISLTNAQVKFLRLLGMAQPPQTVEMKITDLCELSEVPSKV